MVTLVKSSFRRSGECIERKFVASSFCVKGECIEVAIEDGCVKIRDSKLGETSPVLATGTSTWMQLLELIDSVDENVGLIGTLATSQSVSIDDSRMVIARSASGNTVITVANQMDELVFNDAEIEAFEKGARIGEFTIGSGSQLMAASKG